MAISERMKNSIKTEIARLNKQGAKYLEQKKMAELKIGGIVDEVRRLEKIIEDETPAEHSKVVKAA